MIRCLNMNIEFDSVVANFAMDHSSKHIQRHFVDCLLIHWFCDHGLSADYLMDVEGVCVAATDSTGGSKSWRASPFLITPNPGPKRMNCCDNGLDRRGI
jgi:hypothetical protein